MEIRTNSTIVAPPLLLPTAPLFPCCKCWFMAFFGQPPPTPLVGRPRKALIQGGRCLEARFRINRSQLACNYPGVWGAPVMRSLLTTPWRLRARPRRPAFLRIPRLPSGRRRLNHICAPGHSNRKEADHSSISSAAPRLRIRGLGAQNSLRCSNLEGGSYLPLRQRFQTEMAFLRHLPSVPGCDRLPLRIVHPGKRRVPEGFRSPELKMSSFSPFEDSIGRGSRPWLSGHEIGTDS